MKSDTKSKLCDPKLLEIRDLHFSRLENLYSGNPLEYVFVLNGILGQSSTNPYQEPEKWLDECLDNLAEHAEQMVDKAVFRPLVIEYGSYGVHFVDKIFGANVYTHEGQWWSDFLKNPIGKLNPPDLEIYYNELRDDQIIYLNPTATMNVEKALEITGGDRLVVVAEIPHPIPVTKS